MDTENNWHAVSPLPLWRPRSGHITIVYDSQLIVFGGVSDYSPIVPEPLPGFQFYPNPFAISEGATASIEISLNTAATYDVSVTIHNEILTVSAGIWPATAIGQVTFVDDMVVHVSPTLLPILVSSVDPYYNELLPEVQLSVVNTTQLEATTSITKAIIRETDLDVDVLFQLTTQPTKTVQIAVTSTEGISIEPTSLSISADANWNVARSVRVSALPSSTLFDTRQETVTFTSSDEHEDYRGVWTQSLTVQDVPDVVFEGIYEITEGQSVQLGIQPTTTLTDSVTVQFASSDPRLVIDPSSATLVPPDWPNEIFVTISASIDQIVQLAPYTITISALTTSDDLEYSGISWNQLYTITNATLPQASLSGPATVTEGQTIDLELMLSTQPVEDVTVVLGAIEHVTFNPSQATIFAETWDQPRTFQLTAIDHGSLVDERPIQVVATLTSGSFNTQATFDLSILAIEPQAWFELAPTIPGADPFSDILPEGHVTKMVLRMSTAPRAPVNALMNVSAGLYLAPSDFTIMANTWPVAKTIDVFALPDLVVQSTDRLASAGFLLRSDHAAYNEISPMKDFTIQNTTTPWIWVSISGEQNLKYYTGDELVIRFILFSIPTEPVTVTITSTPEGVVITPNTFTIGEDAWDQDYFATVTLPNVTESTIVTLSTALSSTPTNSFSTTVETIIHVHNDDFATFEPPFAEVPEADSRSLTLVVSPEGLTLPADLQVNFTCDNSQVSIVPSVADITSGTIDVQVHVDADNVKQGNRTTSVIATLSSAQDVLFHGRTALARIDIIDTTESGVDLVPTELELTEGEERQITVSLRSSPTQLVSVRPTVVPNDVMLSPWSGDQYDISANAWPAQSIIRVTAPTDSDQQGDRDNTMYLLVYSSDINYAGVVLTVPIRVLDRIMNQVRAAPTGTFNTTRFAYTGWSRKLSTNYRSSPRR